MPERPPPLCNDIGKFLGETVAGPIYDAASQVFESIFGGAAGSSPAEAQSEGIAMVQSTRDAYDNAIATIGHVYRGIIGPKLRVLDESRPAELSRDRIIKLLDNCGAKKSLQAGIDSNLPFGLYPASAVPTWFLQPDWWTRGAELGAINPNGHFILVNLAADAWRADIAAALGCALQELTNDLAVKTAQAEANVSSSGGSGLAVVGVIGLLGPAWAMSR